MRNIASLLAISLLIPCVTLSAQTIKPGSDVRVDVGLRSYQGRVRQLTADSLVMDTVRLPLHSVTRIAVHRRSHPWEGAFIGLLVGGIGGAAFGSASYEECVPEGWFDCMLAPQSEGQAAVLGGILGGSFGAAFGAVLGAGIKTDRWEEVPLDRLRVSFAPKRDGFAVAMKVSF